MRSGFTLIFNRANIRLVPHQNGEDEIRRISGSIFILLVQIPFFSQLIPNATSEPHVPVRFFLYLLMKSATKAIIPNL